MCSVVFAAPQMSVSELMQVRQMFLVRYGKRFPCQCADMHCINPKVVDRLKRNKPSDTVIDHYLANVAARFDIDFSPSPAAAARPASIEEVPPPAPPSPDAMRTDRGGGCCRRSHSTNG